MCNDFAAPENVANPPFGPIAALGSTAMLDAITVALATTVPANRRHLIVVFSDGQDSSSISDPAAVLDVARRTTPTVDIVLASAPPRFTSPSGALVLSGPTIRDELRLTYRQLALETGGIVLTPVSTL